MSQAMPRVSQRRAPAAPPALARACSRAWQVRPLLPWVVAGGEVARCGCCFSASLSQGCSTGPATRVWREQPVISPTVLRPAHGRGGRRGESTASVHFWLEGAVAPTPTFLVRDNAAKSEGSTPRSSRAF